MAKRHYDITKHDREQDRKNLEHRKKSHKGHDPRHLSAHDREVDRENLSHARRARGEHNEGEYAGEYGRRRQELEDSGMIREDKGAIANLPQEVMMKPWPKSRDYMPEVLDDTIRGIDRQIDEDERGRSKNFNKDERQF